MALHLVHLRRPSEPAGGRVVAQRRPSTPRGGAAVRPHPTAERGPAVAEALVLDAHEGSEVSLLLRDGRVAVYRSRALVGPASRRYDLVRTQPALAQPGSARGLGLRAAVAALLGR